MANLKGNTTTIQEILDAVNALPEAGSGGVNVSGVTATAEDVIAGKVFVDSGGIETNGTMPDNGTYNIQLSISSNSVTIPKGKHSGNGKAYITTQSKTVSPSTSAQTILPDSGKVLSSVTVNAAKLQSKTVTPTTSQQTITADSSYYGLSQVIVNAISSSGKAINISAISASDSTNIKIPLYYFDNYGENVNLPNIVALLYDSTQQNYSNDTGIASLVKYTSTSGDIDTTYAICYNKGYMTSTVLDIYLETQLIKEADNILYLQLVSSAASAYLQFNVNNNYTAIVAWL